MDAKKTSGPGSKIKINHRAKLCCPRCGNTETFYKKIISRNKETDLETSIISDKIKTRKLYEYHVRTEIYLGFECDSGHEFKVIIQQFENETSFIYDFE